MLCSLPPASRLLPTVHVASHAAAPAAATHLLSTLPLGGAGGWDYLSFDAPHRHLFVSHGDRVRVIDVDQHEQIDLSAARFGSTPQPNGRHAIAPGSFGILTVGQP